MRVETDDIAKVAHEVNRAYQEAIGETPSPRWEDAPSDQRASAIQGVQAIQAGDVTSPEQAHESWMRLKEAEGWTYGDVKSAADKTHPQLVPYSELTAEQKVKDALFFAVVRAMTP